MIKCTRNRRIREQQLSIKNYSKLWTNNNIQFEKNSTVFAKRVVKKTSENIFTRRMKSHVTLEEKLWNCKKFHPGYLISGGILCDSDLLNVADTTRKTKIWNLWIIFYLHFLDFSINEQSKKSNLELTRSFFKKIDPCEDKS